MQIDLDNYKSFTPLLDVDLFSKMVDVNIKGAVYFVRALTGAMAKQEPLSYTGRHGTRSLGRGSIVLLGSAQSYIAAPGMISYTTGKHAIRGIMKSAGKPPRLPSFSRYGTGLLTSPPAQPSTRWPCRAISASTPFVPPGWTRPVSSPLVFPSCLSPRTCTMLLQAVSLPLLALRPHAV